MMELRDYLKLLKKQQDMIDPEMKNAIEEQTRLHIEVQDKQRIYYDLQDREIELLHAGCDKLFSAHPELKELIKVSDVLSERMVTVYDHFFRQSAEYKTLSEHAELIPELRQHREMQDEIGKAYYEYLMAHINLDRQIKQDRERFFSKEYEEKMDILADQEVLLYFLETPDLPLLEEEYDAKFILDTFYFAEGISLKTLLIPLMEMREESLSMKRKTEDLYVTVELLLNGFYRAAARNIFALLESEHKKGADALEGIFEKRKQFKKGHQRSNKITKLLEQIDLKWERKAWEKIDAFYKRIASPQKQGNTIHRNTIIHGDYQSNDIDVDRYDAMKLFLLWFNMRILADQLSYIDELYVDWLRNEPTILKLKYDKVI